MVTAVVEQERISAEVAPSAPRVEEKADVTTSHIYEKAVLDRTRSEAVVTESFVESLCVIGESFTNMINGNLFVTVDALISEDGERTVGANSMAVGK